MILDMYWEGIKSDFDLLTTEARWVSFSHRSSVLAVSIASTVASEITDARGLG